MLGVDYIIPDWDYLRDKKDFVRAILITHGHLDHIGALPHFLQEFKTPVYATRLTRGLIEVRLRRERMLEQAVLHTYAAGDVICIGPFTIEPYHVSHSIPDSVGLGTACHGANQNDSRASSRSRRATPSTKPRFESLQLRKTRFCVLSVISSFAWVVCWSAHTVSLGGGARRRPSAGAFLLLTACTCLRTGLSSNLLIQYRC
jgi:hypothetical protein